MTLSGDRLDNHFQAILLSVGSRRAAINAGIWNGHLYEDAPATTIMRQSAHLAVTELMT